jgi:hypothetical protein
MNCKYKRILKYVKIRFVFHILLKKTPKSVYANTKHKELYRSQKSD